MNELLKRGAQMTGDRADAAELLSYVTGRSRAELILDRGAATDDVAARFLSLCERRGNGEPLQYITGRAEFMGLTFAVNESVLIPRQDTETLCEYAIKRGGARVLDLCCGSGCIGISYKRFCPESRVTLADISEAALETARKNAVSLCADVEITRADVFDPRFADGAFDLILTNPPYIKSGDLPFLPPDVRREPALALDGGEDGLRFYRALIGWKRTLSPDGELVAEAGYDTAQAVYELFKEEFSQVRLIRDTAGIPRVITAGK